MHNEKEQYVTVFGILPGVSDTVKKVEPKSDFGRLTK